LHSGDFFCAARLLVRLLEASIAAAVCAFQFHQFQRARRRENELIKIKAIQAMQ